MPRADFPDTTAASIVQPNDLNTELPSRRAMLAGIAAAAPAAALAASAAAEEVQMNQAVSPNTFMVSDGEVSPDLATLVSEYREARARLEEVWDPHSDAEEAYFAARREHPTEEAAAAAVGFDVLDREWQEAEDWCARCEKAIMGFPVKSFSDLTEKARVMATTEWSQSIEEEEGLSLIADVLALSGVSRGQIAALIG